MKQEANEVAATLRLALEALKENHYYMIDAGLPNQSMLNKTLTAYKALEEALAQSRSDVKQEPVAEPHKSAPRGGEPVQPDKYLQLALEALAPLEKLFVQAEEQGLLNGANVDCQIATSELRKSAYAASDIRAQLNTTPPAAQPAPVQQEQGEPVAWQYRDANDDGTWSAWNGCDKRLTESDWRKVRPLYATPPQSEARGLSQQQRPSLRDIKPLTFDQIEACFQDGGIWGVDGKHLGTTAQGLHDFARAIEAAHGITSVPDFKE